MLPREMWIQLNQLSNVSGVRVGTREKKKLRNLNSCCAAYRFNLRNYCSLNEHYSIPLIRLDSLSYGRRIEWARSSHIETYTEQEKTLWLQWKFTAKCHVVLKRSNRALQPNKRKEKKKNIKKSIKKKDEKQFKK